MDALWDILILPVIERVNADYIVELGSDTGFNTRNILEYCTNNNARMTTVAPFPNLYIDELKIEYRDIFEYYIENGLSRLPLLENFEVILIEVDNDFPMLFKELEAIEKISLNKKFPLIFLIDQRYYFPNKDSSNLDADESYSIDNDENKNSLLNVVEDFIEESDLELSFKSVYSNLVGVLYQRDEELDNILTDYINNFNIINCLQNEKSLLSEDNEDYENEVKDLRNRIEWNRNEFEFKTNKYRSIPHRLITKFPMLYMFMRIPKIGFKNTLINRKGFYAIQKHNLLDIGYYLTCNSDVRLKGQDPIIHYIYHGFKEGRAPNPKFDEEYYIKTHPDIIKSNINPLVHYALYGIDENRVPGQNLDYKNLIEESGRVTGEIRFNKAKFAVEGFLIAGKDGNSRDAYLKIDNQNFDIKCDINPVEIKQNSFKGIRYYFTFKVPPKFIDGKEHRVKFYDRITDKLIANNSILFPLSRNFNDFSGFLANSIVSPMINTPFREQDKRSFATMESIAKYLSKLALNNVESLVSVIMPVYNRIDTVKDAVDSVLQQSYNNIELIVVDDGSDDGSKELLENIEDHRIVLLTNENCKGVSAARNKGLEAANGKYIAYLDSDNLWDSRYVASMVGAFLKLPDAQAVYSGQLLYNGNDTKPFAVRFGSFNRSLLTNRNYIDLNSFCHTKELYKRIGGFDETLQRLVDYDLIMRMAETGEIYSVPVLLSHYYFDKAENTITKTSGFTSYLEAVKDKRRERQEKIEINEAKVPIQHKVSIIIPSYQALEDITDCIESLLKVNENKLMEIVVVDNASHQPVVDYLTKLADEGTIKLIKNDINYGFTYAVNQGIEAAENGNDIVIMNNDALLTSGAIESLQRKAYELPDCGITVPQQVLPGGTKTINAHVPFAYPHYECDVNLSAAHENIVNVPLFHSGRVVELSFAPFFCVYIKRDVLDRSVGLDAEYGRHYRSDRIFCNYVRHMMNLKVYYIEEAVVYHKLQKSTAILSNKTKKKF